MIKFDSVDFLYNTPVGRALLKVLVRKNVSCIGGKLLNSSPSKVAVPYFIKKYDIDLSDCEKNKFDSFNDFFIRKKKYDISFKDGNLISPCDSFLSIYKVNGKEFKIKNCMYTVDRLLRSKKLAEKFKDGYVFVFRLEPRHYHRYIYFQDGEILKERRIEGVLHSVRPAAYENHKVFVENSREYVLMKNDDLGFFVQMEVGALMVGKIHNHKTQPKVKKGQEKGYFEFGGSTIIVLFEKDKVKPADSISDKCDTGFEIPVKLGSIIGSYTK